MRLRYLLGILFATSLSTAAVPGQSPMSDFQEHLGFQLHSLRAELLKDPVRALDLVKSYGVTYVETNFVPPSMTARRFHELLEARGLKAVSTHFGYNDFQKSLPTVEAQARTLGATYVICSYIPHEGAFTEADALKAAADFNTWGAALKADGFIFGYHPHGFEFQPSSKGGDDKVLDVLIRATNPAYVCFQMDVFWIYHPGGDPVALLNKYPNRWTTLHLKDMRRGAARGPDNGDTAPLADKVAIGQGEIDIPAIIAAAEKIGVKYYFLEDECADPMTTVPESFAYLRSLK